MKMPADIYVVLCIMIRMPSHPCTLFRFIAGLLELLPMQLV